MVRIKIVEHSGDIHLTEVESYNPKELHLEIKDAQKSTGQDHTVCIGNVIVDARSIKSIGVIEVE